MHIQHDCYINEELFRFENLYDTNGFYYWFPKINLEELLEGKGFDYFAGYSEEEVLSLKQDITEIYQRIIDENPIQEPTAILTAGGPGAGKTILLKQHREAEKHSGRTIAYICPDDVALKQMARTYQKSVSEKSYSSQSEKESLLLDCYNKWRPGSNAATHIILANLIKNNYAIYFGTTSTSPHSLSLYEGLAKRGYTIQVLHLTAPVEVRQAAVAERNKNFVQTNGQDLIEKGNLLIQRIMDTYLAFAKTISFYYRENSMDHAFLAAVWVRGLPLAKLNIINKRMYDQVKGLHNETCEKLNELGLTWDKTVESSTEIIEI